MGERTCPAKRLSFLALLVALSLIICMIYHKGVRARGWLGGRPCFFLCKVGHRFVGDCFIHLIEDIQLCLFAPSLQRPREVNCVSCCLDVNDKKIETNQRGNDRSTRKAGRPADRPPLSTIARKHPKRPCQKIPKGHKTNNERFI